MSLGGGMIPLKFNYAHPPAWIITIPYEQQAFALQAEHTYVRAQAEGVILASSWHPPTDVHHTWHRMSPLLMRQMPNYRDFCEPERMGISK